MKADKFTSLTELRAFIKKYQSDKTVIKGEEKQMVKYKLSAKPSSVPALSPTCVWDGANSTQSSKRLMMLITHSSE